MQFILEYQKIILRVVGGLFLVVAIVIHFWSMPKPALSENEKALANLERMQASVAAKSSVQKPNASHYLKHLKETQKKQLEYLTILLIVLGVGALGYTFIKRD